MEVIVGCHCQRLTHLTIQWYICDKHGICATNMLTHGYVIIAPSVIPLVAWGHLTGALWYITWNPKLDNLFCWLDVHDDYVLFYRVTTHVLSVRSYSLGRIISSTISVVGPTDRLLIVLLMFRCWWKMIALRLSSASSVAKLSRHRAVSHNISRSA